MNINGRNLDVLPGPTYLSKPAHTISNITVETAFTTLIGPIPSLGAGRFLGFTSLLESVRTGSDAARLRLKMAPFGQSLVDGVDAVELASFDIDASGLLWCRGALHVHSGGGAAQVYLLAELSTSGGLGASNVPLVQGATVDLSAPWKLGWTLQDIPTWGASSSVRVLHMY